MRRILDTRGARGSVLLVLLVCFVASIEPLDVGKIEQVRSSFGVAGLVGLVAIGVVIGSIFVLAGWLLISAMATLAGRFLGGTGTFRQVCAALAWGGVPFLYTLAYKIPAIALWPRTLSYVRSREGLVWDERGLRFNLTALDEMSIPHLTLLFVLELLFVVWYVVVSSRTLAEAQGVSSWAGFANFVAAFALPVVAAIAIGIAAMLSF